VAQRTQLDADGYARAAAMMVELAERSAIGPTRPAQKHGAIIPITPKFAMLAGTDGIRITACMWRKS
jgi:hypothetical protein